MDSTVHGVPKSRTRLSDFHFQRPISFHLKWAPTVFTPGCQGRRHWLDADPYSGGEEKDEGWRQGKICRGTGAVSWRRKRGMQGQGMKATSWHWGWVWLILRSVKAPVHWKDLQGHHGEKGERGRAAQIMESLECQSGQESRFYLQKMESHWKILWRVNMMKTMRSEDQRVAAGCGRMNRPLV